jgi:hypothetical protein
MPKNTGFTKTFFFENEFNGVIPLESWTPNEKKRCDEIVYFEKMDDLRTISGNT